jgi:hypothetical protein
VAQDLLELSRVLTAQELRTLLSTTLRIQTNASGGGGGGGGDRAALRGTLGRVLRQQLTADPTRGSILYHFSSASAAASGKSGGGGKSRSRSAVASALRAACGRCVRLSSTATELLRKAELLFYLESARLHEPNAVFVLQRLGHVRFVPYKAVPTSLFATRAALDAYQEALSTLQEVDQQLNFRSGVGRRSRPSKDGDSTERLARSGLPSILPASHHPTDGRVIRDRPIGPVIHPPPVIALARRDQREAGRRRRRRRRRHV